MGFGVGNPGAVNPNQGPQQNVNNNSFEAIEKNLEQALETFDVESMAVTREMAGKKSSTTEQLVRQHVQQTGNGKVPDELVAEMAAIFTEEEVERKSKKKKTNLEEQMEQLAKLEGSFDETQLQEQEKGIIREFFDNMARIKQLRTRLRQLEKQEDFYADRLKDEERRREQEKQEHKGDSEPEEQDEKGSIDPVPPIAGL